MADNGITLESSNHAQLATWLEQDDWVVACLCAAWCDTCRSYRDGFDRLAVKHPDKRFVWIDIEDQADIVGDIDVENFPTLLIQRGDHVAFFGTVLPDPGVAERLLTAQAEKSRSELCAETAASPQRQAWQRDIALRTRLAAG